MTGSDVIQDGDIVLEALFCLYSGQGRDDVSLEPDEVVSPPSPLRIGSEAPTLPSKEDGAGKKGQSLPAVVCPNPGLTETRGEEPTLTHRKEADSKRPGTTATSQWANPTMWASVQHTVYQGD